MKYRCPYCGEILSEQEADQVCDCGCPSCRRSFELTDFELEADEEDEFGIENIK